MSGSQSHNSLATGLKWSWKDHHFTGYSIAGITTSLVYDNASCVFDIGQGLPFNIPKNHFFLTHPHSDHSGGLAYVLSQRSMWSLPPATVYSLPQYIDPLKNIIESWQKIEDFNYSFHMVPMPTGHRVQVNKEYAVESFPTHHRVSAQGYTVIKTKKKLKKEFIKKPESELIELRKNNVEIDEIIEDRIFSFTGDTSIEFLDSFTKPVSVLFMETTFIDELKDVAAARKWGHIHLDEWADRVASIPAEKIVLIHLSARYSTKTILETLDKKIPKNLREKIELFPRPF